MKDKLIEFVSIQLDKDLKEPLYVQLYGFFKNDSGISAFPFIP